MDKVYTFKDTKKAVDINSKEAREMEEKNYQRFKKYFERMYDTKDTNQHSFTIIWNAKTNKLQILVKKFNPDDLTKKDNKIFKVLANTIEYIMNNIIKESESK